MVEIALLTKSVSTPQSHGLGSSPVKERGATSLWYKVWTGTRLTKTACLELKTVVQFLVLSRPIAF